MNWLVVIFAIEAGLVPNNAWWLYEQEELHEAPGYYTTIEAEAEIGETLFVGGSIRTDMTTNNHRNFNPHWVTYDFTVGARWQFLEVGWRHRCSHPIQTYVYDQEDLKTPLLEGAYDEVYVRAQFQVGGDDD